MQEADHEDPLSSTASHDEAPTRGSNILDNSRDKSGVGLYGVPVYGPGSGDGPFLPFAAGMLEAAHKGDRNSDEGLDAPLVEPAGAPDALGSAVGTRETSGPHGEGEGWATR